MKRYAVIDNSTSTVVNTIVWDGLSKINYPVSDFSFVASQDANIGDSYKSGSFVKPLPKKTKGK